MEIFCHVMYEIGSQTIIFSWEQDSENDLSKVRPEYTF